MIDFDLVQRLRPRVSGTAVRTPCLPSEWLSARSGARVWLKCENLQATGSFKLRGPLCRLPELTADERKRGVLGASAGNHGKGLAWAARHYGIPCTVFVPRTVPANKEEAIRGFGAKVIKTEYDGYDDTAEAALKEAGRSGAVWVPPFDDDAIVAGNGGTTALEIFEDLPDLDAVVMPCGGGGLAIGAGVVARALRPKTRIIGVNSDASPGMWLSRRDGRAHLRVASRPTIAEGLEGGVSESSYEVGKRFIDEIVVVREEGLRRSVAEVLLRDRMVIEGSAAVVVSALLEKVLPAGLKRICLVFSGSNIDESRLREALATHG